MNHIVQWAGHNLTWEIENEIFILTHRGLGVNLINIPKGTVLEQSHKGRSRASLIAVNLLSGGARHTSDWP